MKLIISLLISARIFISVHPYFSHLSSSLTSGMETHITWILNALQMGPCCVPSASFTSMTSPREQVAPYSPEQSVQPKAKPLKTENRNIMIQAACGIRVFLWSGFAHSPDTQRCVRWQAFVWCNGSVLLWLKCVRERRMLGGDVVWSLWHTVCVCQWKKKRVCV